MVVEGYFDALALYRAGFENTVATLGTALTSQHGRILQRYTKEVVFSYDSDEAGQAAVLRGFEPLAQAGLNIRVLVMADVKDPDEYLTKHTKDELAVLIQKAPDFFRWWAISLKKKFQNAPVEDRMRALQGVVPLILQLPSEVQVLAACAAVESELSLNDRDLTGIIHAERKKDFRKPVTEPKTTKVESTTGSRQDKTAIETNVSQWEADFLALLTEENGDFIPWAVNELSPEVFHLENLRQIFLKMGLGK